MPHCLRSLWHPLTTVVKAVVLLAVPLYHRKLRNSSTNAIVATGGVNPASVEMQCPTAAVLRSLTVSRFGIHQIRYHEYFAHDSIIAAAGQTRLPFHTKPPKTLPKQNEETKSMKVYCDYERLTLKLTACTASFEFSPIEASGPPKETAVAFVLTLSSNGFSRKSRN